MSSRTKRALRAVRDRLDVFDVDRFDQLNRYERQVLARHELRDPGARHGDQREGSAA